MVEPNDYVTYVKLYKALIRKTGGSSHQYERVCFTEFSQIIKMRYSVSCEIINDQLAVIDIDIDTHQ